MPSKRTASGSTYPGGSLLLDTNSAIARISEDEAITAVLDRAPGVCVPYVVLGELYYGAYRSARVEQNLVQVREFARGRTILYANRETVRTYGETKQRLKSKGRPIPENDIWIAALALQHGLSVITRDKHFGEVKGLAVVSW